MLQAHVLRQDSNHGRQRGGKHAAHRAHGRRVYPDQRRHERRRRRPGCRKQSGHAADHRPLGLSRGACIPGRTECWCGGWRHRTFSHLTSHSEDAPAGASTDAAANPAVAVRTAALLCHIYCNGVVRRIGVHRGIGGLGDACHDPRCSHWRVELHHHLARLLLHVAPSRRCTKGPAAW